MSGELKETKQWQRNRALILHREFSDLANRIETEGAKLTPEIRGLKRKLNGTVVTNGVRVSRRSGVQERKLKTLRLSTRTLLREWYRWNNGDRIAEALLLNYKAGLPKIPAELVAEVQRRCTLPTGGRDKHGLAPITFVYNWLREDFREGKPIPGINYADYAAGAEFPYSESTIRRCAPPPAERALGNRGFAAFKTRACHITRDYSKLRKCELYTLDDARLDLLCIEDWSGRATVLKIYLMMEVASRLIVGFVIKPENAICAEDVDELVTQCLQADGFGIGVGYTTYILFERGTVACSNAAQAMLEGVTEGRVQIIRTKMNGGVTWTGAPRDKASGNAAGKAVIESFIRRLHYALLHLPGQIGNNFENAPANVGFGNGAPGTLVYETQKLAKLEVALTKSMRARVRLQLPMLRFSEVQDAVKAAIAKHNHEPGHDYADHGQFVEAEVEPGVWKETQGGVAELANAADTAAATARVDRRETATLEGSSPSPTTKAFVLDTPAKPLTPQQRAGMYWRLWKAAQAAQPDANRFAITARVIGRVKKIRDMIDEEFLKVCHVFESIAKKGKAA
jgi:hypothetical protein